MEITLKTLTPLWTAGAGGTCDRLHETGIIGSMRWWYEAIVRGLGGWACDPTDDGCIYERKKGESHKQAYDRLCDACRLFGCTGWRRRFKLSADIGSKPSAVKFCLASLDENNQWWLSKVFGDATKGVHLFVDVDMDVHFLPGVDHTDAFKGLLSVMAHYGAIGAKPQYGFGQFDWDDKLSPAAALDAIRPQLNASRHLSSTPPDYYTLQDFWHIDCFVSQADPLVQQFKRASVIGDESTFKRLREKYLPVSFDIRYKLPGSNEGLREAYRRAHRKMAARKVFGTLKGDKRGSRIFVSHLYKKEAAEDHYRLNVWGFTKPDIGNEMHQQLKRLFPGASFKMITGPQLLGQGGANQ